MRNHLRQVIVASVLLCITGTASAQAVPVQPPAVISVGPQPAAETAIHIELERHGVGHRVRLVEIDGQTRGRIVAIGPDTVTLHTDAGVDEQVSLIKIRSVRGGGLSHTAKVWIGWTTFFALSITLAALGSGGFHD